MGHMSQEGSAPLLQETGLPVFSGNCWLEWSCCLGMGQVKKGMEEVTPSCSSSHGEWEGLLVELEAWIFP